MATVVITFFLFVRFYVCKMDADCSGRESDRDLFTSVLERQDRFSMDPERFANILGNISKCYNNIRSSFENLTISDVFEEILVDYVNEALTESVGPSLVELSVVLQHCALLYGRKVDYLHTNAVDLSRSLAGDAAAPSESTTGRRARGASVGGAPAAWGHIAVSAHAGARRAAEPPRPPPTLARAYPELEPHAPQPHEEPLRDCAGEPLGPPAQYHVTRRLRDGFLVEELACAAPGGASLRPLSLLELQEALAEGASPLPSTPPPPGTPPSPGAPPPPGTPSHAPLPPPLATSTPLPPAAPPCDGDRPRRRRRSAADVHNISDPLKKFLSDEEHVGRMADEFSVPSELVEGVVHRRARRLLRQRGQAARDCLIREFRGFEDQYHDAGGFAGWSAAEARESSLRAAAAAAGASQRLHELESDDEGFFDRSSFSSFSSLSGTDYFSPTDPLQKPAPTEPAAPAERAAPRAGDAAPEPEPRGPGGQAAGEAAPDVRVLGRAVLAVLAGRAGRAGRGRLRPLAFSELVRELAARPQDVSRLLLTVLFLANSGNVEITPAAPLSMGSFSVTLLSTDETMYADAAAAQFEEAESFNLAEPAHLARPDDLAELDRLVELDCLAEPDYRASPQISEPASPQISEPASPQMSEPASPQMSEPASPQMSEPASPQVSEPASPQTSEPASPPPKPSRCKRRQIEAT